MLDNKAKNTAKVLSSHPDKMACKGTSAKVPQMRAGKAQLKTLDDYFNSHSDKGRSSSSEDDTETSWILQNEKISYNDNDCSDGDQTSIVGAVFKQLMRS